MTKVIILLILQIEKKIDDVVMGTKCCLWITEPIIFRFLEQRVFVRLCKDFHKRYWV